MGKGQCTKVLGLGSFFSFIYYGHVYIICAHFRFHQLLILSLQLWYHISIVHCSYPFTCFGIKLVLWGNINMEEVTTLVLVCSVGFIGKAPGFCWLQCCCLLALLVGGLVVWWAVVLSGAGLLWGSAGWVLGVCVSLVLSVGLMSH